MNRNTLYSNIVKKEELREVQGSVLKIASDAVMNTAGVKGSNTMILHQNLYPNYSKDGKRVLENIKFFGNIENNILDELSQIVTYVVSEVGDGTTSTVRMCYYIFNALLDLAKEYKWTDYDLIRSLTDAAETVADKVLHMGREVTVEDIYNICMISTNGNKEIATDVQRLYAAFGTDVFINVGVSNTADTIVKTYDGMTLEKGYASPAYINTKDGKCILRNPRIYIFNDPIDTEEMISLFTRIVYTNILEPMTAIQQGRNATYVPTLIITPSISRDAMSLLEELEVMLYSFDKNDAAEAKPPIAIISQLNRYVDDVSDIAKLTGCRSINKYIDPTVQAKDIELGKAPTVENIVEFYGTAESVEIDKLKTKIINPQMMYEKNEDGSLVIEDGNPVFSSVYNGMVSFFEAQIQSAKDENEDDVSIKILRRRLANLKANMVDYLIGGISVSDREAAKDLAEDAILNCRSAAKDGVGYGCNFMGLLATKAVINDLDNANINTSLLTIKCLEVIEDAYTELIKELYGTCIHSGSVNAIFNESLENKMPINLKTLEFDGKVLSSIASDAVIIRAIAKVLSIMITANQALVLNPVDNPYRPDNHELD